MRDYFPRVTLDTCNALIVDYSEEGYLERLSKKLEIENEELHKFIFDHFSDLDEERLGDVYESAMLTYKLIKNQLESDILDAAYKST
jgi:hypothetical protein